MSGWAIARGAVGILGGLLLLLCPRQLAEYDVKARRRKPWPQTRANDRLFLLLRCAGVVAIAVGVFLFFT